MTDPFEQARASIERVDHEPDWAALRSDTLARVARDRAEHATGRDASSPRWTALVAAAAVAAVVAGVVGVTQLTDRQTRPDPAPVASTPLDRLSPDEVLDRVRATVLDEDEPLAAAITFVHGRDETATLTVGPDALVLETEGYTYVEQERAGGGDSRATLVNHERRSWLVDGDGRSHHLLLSRLPSDLARVATEHALAPLFDSGGWQAAVSRPGSDGGRLTLTLTPAPTPGPTLPPTSSSGPQPVRRTEYVVDTRTRLPVSVRVLSDAGAPRLEGTVTWVPARGIVPEELVPSGYRPAD